MTIDFDISAAYGLLCLVPAALPGIARPPHLYRGAPVPSSEIELAVLGCVVVVTFGVFLGLIWNRVNARNVNAKPD